MSEAFPITSDPRFRIYTASAAQTTFSVPFPWQDNADIEIWRTPLEGDPFVLGEGVHYTLAGAGEINGGSFVLLEGYEAAAGELFLVKGDAQLSRVSSIAQGGRFRTQGTDNDLDRMVLIAQEIYRELGRTLRVALGELPVDVVPGDDNTLALWLNGKLVGGPIWGDDVGIPGPGVPTGGTTGQFLVKASSADYDTTWDTLEFSHVDMTNVATITTPAAADEVLVLETSVAGARKRWSLTNLQEWIRTKLGAMISASGAKSTPVDADQIGISDSAASNGPAKVSFLNAWANYFKGKADAIYAINGTGNTFTAQQLELGHATDTTLSRSAAGVMAVEGNVVPSPGSQASGDTLYRGASSWSRLAKGTARQRLQMNSGATAPEWASDVFGTYTPTLTAVANVAATTSAVCSYFRFGDMVMVTGTIDVDPTNASSTVTTVGISLPIASNLAATTDLAGVGNSAGANIAGAIIGSVANDRAELTFNATSSANNSWGFCFMYRVL